MSTELTDRDIARSWWLFMGVGVLWLFFGFFLLSFDFGTVWGVAAFAGIGFLVGGLLELIAGFSNKQHRGLNITLGLVGIVAGIACLAWPGMTYLVFARTLAWLLFVSGTINVIASLMNRHENDTWGLQLVLGLLEIGIGIWAIRYVGNSLVLLALVAGIAAISHGIGDIVIGFGLHGVNKEYKRGGPTPAAA